MSALPEKHWTAEEYLAFERASAEKHEFVDGDVYLMTGASRSHNLIVVNTTAALHAQFRGRPCEVYASDMRVRVGGHNYVYPDVIVVCGEPQLDDTQGDTLLNPTVMIEVLSPTTEQYDRGRKFHLYRRIEGLEEYVLIAQEMALIERYRRQEGGQWLYSDASAPDAALALDSIGARLALADVYDKVTFDAPEA